MAKRTRNKQVSRGLGDTIEKITEATGVKKAIKVFSEVTGVDCGCDKRKQWLNEKFSYRMRNCMTEKEHNIFAEFLKDRKENSYSSKQVFNLINMHARVFGMRPKICTNCDGAVKVMNDVVSNLNNVFESYGKESNEFYNR